MPDFVPDQQWLDSAVVPHGGRLVARALKHRGVDTIFAVSGGHILGILDGCLDEGIRVVDTRHEGAASLAAEGWALATGTTGVAVVTAGPGFSNALTAFIDAGVWTVPMLLIAGRTGIDKAGRGAIMDVDQKAVVSPIAKWADTCFATERIPAYVDEAIYRARAGKPGPAYLEIPMDVLGARTVPNEAPAPGGHPGTMPAPAGAPDAVERALETLERAERPVIVAGGGAFWSGAGPELARLCEIGGIPVTTTSAARGLVPDAHPWCLGGLIHGGAALLAADVVLVLGSSFNANVVYGGPPLFRADQTIIQVDVVAENLGGNRLPDVAIAGDACRVVTDLADAWRKSPDTRAPWRAEAHSLVEMSRSMWDTQVDSYEGSLVHPGALCREVCSFVGKELSDGATVVADGGDAYAWALAYAHAEGPGRLLTTTTALGTLGVGLPYAIAAKAARPDEPVVLIAGDGAFGLSAMEIETAARLDLPVVVVVSNNGAWGDVGHEQDAWFGPGRRIASELTAARYDRLADSLGGHGEHVTALGDLRPALERALESGRVAVVNVETDPGVLSDLLKGVGQMGLM